MSDWELVVASSGQKYLIRPENAFCVTVEIEAPDGSSVIMHCERACDGRSFELVASKESVG